MGSPSQVICTYATVTLQPGEQFTLPPGAEIISVSNLANVSSSCEIPTNLETLACYIIAINAADDANSQSPAWSNDTTTLNGIFVGGTFYSFGLNLGDWIGAGGDVETNNLQNWITTHATLSTILTCTGSASGQDSPGTRGGVGTICFKTIPSLASDMYIKVSTSVPGHGSSFAFFPARPIADYTSEHKCNCGC